MTDHPTIPELVDKLQTFGSSRQIAQFFVQENITGVTAQSFKCAVAEYLTRETGKPAQVSFAWAKEKYDSVSDPVMIADYSPLQDFIREFDRGEYPELIASD